MGRQIKARGFPGSIMHLRGILFRAALRRARWWHRRYRFRASRFLFVPPHLHLADPSVAADFLAGQIVLAGRSLLTGGRSPLDMPLPSAAFACAFHGFDWLRHFEAAGSPDIRAGAREILTQWMTRREAGQLPEAEMPAAIPRRVIAWLTHSALLTSGADFAGYARLLDHLARDAAMLHVLAGRRAIGMIRLEAAIALLFHALALNRSGRAIDEAEALVMTALIEGIAADGGPANRDAGTAVLIASNLIPLLALYRARQRPTPDALSPALLGLATFVRMMQQPDGGLALFNNAGLVTRDLVAQVAQFGKRQAVWMQSAPDTGFERLEDEHGIVIADAGFMPRAGFGCEAGAGALAFEFSTRSDRIIVNCGMPPSASREVAAGFRQGAAHSTVLIEDRAPVRLASGESLLSGDITVPVSDGKALRPRRDNSTLLLGHHGLIAMTGVEIERELTLLPRGGGLAGRDRFIDHGTGEAGRRITLAFHLHPRVLPVPLSRKDALVLRLPHQTPGRDMWLFETPGLAIQLESSLCYEQDIISPATEVIVVEFIMAGTTEINWRLTPYQG